MGNGEAVMGFLNSSPWSGALMNSSSAKRGETLLYNALMMSDVSRLVYPKVPCAFKVGVLMCAIMTIDDQ